jgi:5-methylcytosine-specific restriction endonuclease McrA
MNHNSNLCSVHKHRELVPIDRHHIWPLGEGGPDIEENLVAVCPNGHRQIHDLLRRMKKGKGVVTWLVARRYGKKVRAYAKLGYDRIQRGAM